MKRKKVEAWARVDSSGCLFIIDGGSRKEAVKAAATWNTVCAFEERHRVVHLVEADPAKEAVYRVVLAWRKKNQGKPMDLHGLYLAIEGALSKGGGK